MRQDKLSKQNLILYACGIIPVVWLALLIAPAFGGDQSPADRLPNLIENLGTVFNNPFHIEWCEDSLKTVLIFILAYGMGIGIYLSSAGGTRLGKMGRAGYGQQEIRRQGENAKQNSHAECRHRAGRQKAPTQS